MPGVHILVDTAQVLATVRRTPDEEADEHLQVLLEMAGHLAAGKRRSGGQRALRFAIVAV